MPWLLNSTMEYLHLSEFLLLRHVMKIEKEIQIFEERFWILLLQNTLYAIHGNFGVTWPQKPKQVCMIWRKPLIFCQFLRLFHFLSSICIISRSIREFSGHFACWSHRFLQPVLVRQVKEVRKFVGSYKPPILDVVRVNTHGSSIIYRIGSRISPLFLAHNDVPVVKIAGRTPLMILDNWFQPEGSAIVDSVCDFRRPSIPELFFNFGDIFQGLFTGLRTFLAFVCQMESYSESDFFLCYTYV